MNVRKYGLEFFGGYKLYWDELDTPEKLEAKLAHMRRKGWFTPEHEQFVIQAVEERSKCV